MTHLFHTLNVLLYVPSSNKDGKLAMVHSKAQNYVKFPGGGIEETEDHPKALIREVLEEVGLNIIPETINEFGLGHDPSTESYP